MANYESITKLAADIEEEFVKTNEEQEFLPCDKLGELVTRDRVLSAFQDANISNEEDLVVFALNEAKRIFLILVMMSETEEKLSLLRGLQDNGMNDESLPIGLDKENRKHYGYSLEGSRYGGPQFAVFNEWMRNDRVLFESNQWKFTAPVFDNNKFRFQFSPKRILPYLVVAPKPSSSGFFGEVSRIEIHPAHIPELEAVRNLPLLFSFRLNSAFLGSSHRKGCDCCQEG